MTNLNPDFYFAANFDDETSDSYSNEFPGFSPHSDKENVYYNCDQSSVSSESKKIRKKRNAYQKIDDETRLELLEAVQKRGETLKSAAKRLNINYSSAKSILHTYRKEGRILKKSALDRPINLYPINSYELDIGSINHLPPITFENLNPNKINFPECFGQNNYHHAQAQRVQESGPSSPLRGLTANFGTLFLSSQQIIESQNMSSPQISNAVRLSHSSSNDYSSTTSSLDFSYVNTNATISQNPSNPLEQLKYMDNFYMNYSNSPLSGGGANINKEQSNTGSRTAGQKEFDSFTDMMNSFQDQSCLAEEFNFDSQVIRPTRPNVASEKFEAKTSQQENFAWNETYKNFINAPNFLSSTLNKVSN